MAAPKDVVDLDSGPQLRDIARLCTATREVRPVAAMIRFVVDPSGAVVPDLKQKLPGRGVWVTATRMALDDAVKRKLFARGFRRDVVVRPDLRAHTEHLLERSVLDALAMAGKAGLAMTGFAKANNALAHNAPAALIHAADAAGDGIRKLEAAARRYAAEPVVVNGCFTAAQMDLALDRSNVIHAALLAGGPTDTFLARFRRLQDFRTGEAHRDSVTAGPGHGRPAENNAVFGIG